MIQRSNRTLEELVNDDDLFDRAVARAQAEAIRRHGLLGQPIATWRNGRVVIEVPTAPPPRDDVDRD